MRNCGTFVPRNAIKYQEKENHKNSRWTDGDETVISSEVLQTQKNNCLMFLVAFGGYLNLRMCVLHLEYPQRPRN